MKKMNEKAMKATNGGWGTWCEDCKKGKIFAWYNKIGAWTWALDHISDGHIAYVC